MPQRTLSTASMLYSPLELFIGVNRPYFPIQLAPYLLSTEMNTEVKPLRKLGDCQM